jgi:hypothetical protein
MAERLGRARALFEDLSFVDPPELLLLDIALIFIDADAAPAPVAGQ